MRFEDASSGMIRSRKKLKCLGSRKKSVLFVEMRSSIRVNSHWWIFRDLCVIFRIGRQPKVAQPLRKPGSQKRLLLVAERNAASS